MYNYIFQKAVQAGTQEDNIVEETTRKQESHNEIQAVNIKETSIEQDIYKTDHAEDFKEMTTENNETEAEGIEEITAETDETETEDVKDGRTKQKDSPVENLKEISIETNETQIEDVKDNTIDKKNTSTEDVKDNTKEDNTSEAQVEDLEVLQTTEEQDHPIEEPQDGLLTHIGIYLYYEKI